MPAPRFVQVSLSGPGLVEEITTAIGGIPNAEKIPSLGADGLLHTSMMPIGIVSDTQTLIASEALAAGNLINVWNNGGTVSARKADAATNRPANGFVLAAYLAGASALVYFDGSDSQLSGLTLGADHYLGAAGAPTTTIPTTPGYIRQYVGVAIATTIMNFEYGEPILLA